MSETKAKSKEDRERWEIAEMQLHEGEVISIGRPSGGKRWRALLISDMHLANEDGASYFPASAGEAAIASLCEVVQREKPLQVFLLGDIFHSPKLFSFHRPPSNEWCDATFARIVSAACKNGAVQLTAMGGNHDRRLFDSHGAQWQQNAANSGVELRAICGVPSAILELASAAGKKCYLTHDGGNALRLTPARIVPYLVGLKEANGIDPSTLLVTGHTHAVVDMSQPHNRTRVASIGCFTGCDLHSPGLDYGVLEETDDGEFAFRACSAMPIPSGSMRNVPVIDRADLDFGGSCKDGVRIAKLNGVAVVVKDSTKELEVLSRIPPHPRVVRLVGRVQRPPGAVLEYLGGGSVESLLRKDVFNGESAFTRMGVLQRTAICRDAAEAMSHCHEHGLIIRDLAMRNLMLEDVSPSTSLWRTKVIDFGWSLWATDRVTGRTSVPMVVTAPWRVLAPESISFCTAATSAVLTMPPPPTVFSFASDVWSLGVLCFGLGTGRRPYAGVAQDAIVQVVKTGIGPSCGEDVAWTPAVVGASALCDIAKLCLAVDPAMRPSATAVFDMLCKLFEQTQQPVTAK